MVERAYAEPGFRGVCIREVQKDLSESAKRLIEDKIATFGLSAHFDCQRSQIITPGGGVIIFEGMQDHNSESIKSLEGFDVAWVEEAQTLSARSLGMLRPTIRKTGSEIWFSWNPRRKTDAVDAFFRGENATRRAALVKANHQDNPWFPQELEDERAEDEELRPEQYPHVWDGDYQAVTEGAYYAPHLTEAKKQNRIGFVVRDPNMAVRTFWDLGRRDFTSIWVAQWVGQKINVIDYIEGAGQGPGYYFDQLRERGYRGCMVYLPHDGSRVGPESASGRSYEDQAKDAGFDVEIIRNQGQSAAMLRVDAARRLFPRVWFAEEKTEAGREALGAYHERKDDKRNIGLGPEHDWSSHAADAFGLMCVAYEEPQMKRASATRQHVGAGGWMG